ncbi:integrase catalytic domain-containing protein [Trichonephila clavipes]|nr:integrase catalytic domain-containing protein [Trichonephila clavipes]
MHQVQSGSFGNTLHTKVGTVCSFTTIEMSHKQQGGDCYWKHVSSKNNPAVLFSRGRNVDELLKNEMWFSGPDLLTDEYEDNQLLSDPSYKDELKCAVFINNIKAKKPCYKDKYLTADELKRSMEFLARVAKLSEFKAENDTLKKVYVAIFVCLAAKAIHIETVTDLTIEAFITALKRLCARRGRISTLMSNNATKFKGAAVELNRFIKLICNKNETLANYFAQKLSSGTLSLLAPNFGDLWEAGVKSFKRHLYRTLVDSRITFKEFETNLIQIESILNSRSLVPLSNNINKYEVLTPGHFVIGRPISAIPESAILDISDNRLSRWQYATKCVL